MAPSSSTTRRGWGKIRKIGSGRYHASYISPIDGLRHNAATTYDNKMDAEAWLAAERRLIELEAWSPPAERAKKRHASSISLEEYTKRWLEERQLADSTRALHTTHAEKRIYPVLGDVAVVDMTPALVRTWWASMGSYYPTARRHAYSVLRAVLNTAVEDKLLADNPCRINVPTASERDVEALSPASLDIVAGKVLDRYRAVVHALAWTSLRFGELIELRRSDVEDDGTVMRLRVRRAAARVGNRIVVGNTKTARSKRPVTVPPHVAQIIRKHIEDYTGPGEDALLFTTTRGERLSKSAFTRSLKKGYAEIGRPELRVHDLRAVGATFAAQAGATTKELMARLGHTTPRMAMRYQMASEARDEELAEAMSELANAKNPPG